MGKLVNPMERIVQRSIGFNMRQIIFFSKYKEFKPDQFAREAIDQQIALIDPEYLKDEEE